MSTEVPFVELLDVLAWACDPQAPARVHESAAVVRRWLPPAKGRELEHFDSLIAAVEAGRSYPSVPRVLVRRFFALWAYDYSATIEGDGSARGVRLSCPEGHNTYVGIDIFLEMARVVRQRLAKEREIVGNRSDVPPSRGKEPHGA
jgi:hypothetical protein